MALGNFDYFIIKVIASCLFIILNAAILWITTILFGLEDNDFKTSLLISILVGFTLLVFSNLPFSGWLTAALTHIITIALFKRFYKYGWAKTMVIWLIWLILFLILSILFATLLVIT